MFHEASKNPNTQFQFQFRAWQTDIIIVALEPRFYFYLWLLYNLLRIIIIITSVVPRIFGIRHTYNAVLVEGLYITLRPRLIDEFVHLFLNDSISSMQKYILHGHFVIIYRYFH